MSTNKTENYQLHSWVPEDDFHLTEINENFTKLDQALDQELKKRDATLKKKGQLVTGTYTGNGESAQTFDLGAPVLAVLIECYNGKRPSTNSSVTQGGLIFLDHGLGSGAAYISGNTFSVCAGGGGLWEMNKSNVVYYYLAWIQA